MKDNNKDMLGRVALTSVKDAKELFLHSLPDSVDDTETVALLSALGRVTAEDIICRENLPATRRSCMDGYALSAKDSYGATESMPAYLNVTGEVLMGELPTGSVKAGDCYKIPTGGSLPDGTDSVIMFEHTIPIDSTLIEIIKSVGEGANISKPGEDIATDEVAIKAGHELKAQDLGLLAGIGISEVVVKRKVKVGVLSTGDEIVAHDEQLTPGKIRNINSIALFAQAQSLGAECTDYGIVKDDYDTFMAVINKAIDENDIVLFSGGSSVGMRDLGERIIGELGPPGVLVHGTALKPGKPVILGMAGTKAVVGLPGHPVSAMTCFDVFVAPAIVQLSGKAPSTIDKPSITAKLQRNINSAPGRRDVVRVQVSKDVKSSEHLAMPVMGRSGSISVLSKAHGYFIIEESRQGYSEGDSVKIFLY